MTLMKGHTKVYQQIKMPRINDLPNGGLEVFAMWQPEYWIAPTYYTDANGFELMERSSTYRLVDPNNFS